MDNIRCLIADMPHILLADIIHEIIAKQPGIEVLGYIEDMDELTEKLKAGPVDVLVCGQDKTVFQSLDEIFEVIPTIAVVGIVNDGRRVCVCVEDFGPSELVLLIRAVLARNEIN